MELTLELSQNKWPPAEQLPQLFTDNLPALLALPVVAAFGGARCVHIRCCFPALAECSGQMQCRVVMQAVLPSPHQLSPTLFCSPHEATSVLQAELCTT